MKGSWGSPHFSKIPAFPSAASPALYRQIKKKDEQMMKTWWKKRRFPEARFIFRKFQDSRPPTPRPVIAKWRTKNEQMLKTWRFPEALLIFRKFQDFRPPFPLFRQVMKQRCRKWGSNDDAWKQETMIKWRKITINLFLWLWDSENL